MILSTTPTSCGITAKTPITFTLIVYGFGVKYVDRAHAENLISALKDLYKLINDWTGSLYMGITLNCQYDKGNIDVFMPGYIANILHKFQHPVLSQSEQASHTHAKQYYGANIHITVP